MINRCKSPVDHCWLSVISCLLYNHKVKSFLSQRTLSFGEKHKFDKSNLLFKRVNQAQDAETKQRMLDEKAWGKEHGA